MTFPDENQINADGIALEIRELVDLLNDALAVTKFRTKKGEEVSPDQLQSAFSDADGRTCQVRDTLTAKPEVPEEHIEILENHLRTLLKECIPQGGVGSGYFGYSDIWIGRQDRDVGAYESRLCVDGYRTSAINCVSAPSFFSKTLVYAAGRIGAEATAHILLDWMNGKPRNFKVSAVLSGVQIEDSVRLANGISLYNLPYSSENFPNSIPEMTPGVKGGLLGKTVIEIPGSTTPSLFKPTFTNDRHTDTVQSSVALGDASLQDVTVSLSLVSNHRVDCAALWADSCESTAFSNAFFDHFQLVLLEPRRRLDWRRVKAIHDVGTGIIKQNEPDPPDWKPNLVAKDVERAWNLLPQLIGRRNRDERFKIAVERWMEAVSHDTRSLDRLIDLRIALEALYIDSDQGELSFRLALTAARHLGASLDERRAIQRSLRDFYSLSSRAVHGTAISQLKETDVAVIEQATKLCRDGILRIVETNDRPNWNDLLLS